MTTSNKHLVAVYGTLKKGQGNHHLIKNASLICTTVVLGYDMQCNGGFPQLKKGKEGYTVPCLIEVYEVDEEQLENMDRLEGVKHCFYNRIDIKNDLGKHDTLRLDIRPVYLYEYGSRISTKLTPKNPDESFLINWHRGHTYNHVPVSHIS